MKICRLILPILLLPALLFFLAPQSLHAGSATWNLNPTNSDWNTAANWVPATVPNAILRTWPPLMPTSAPHVTLSASVQVDSLVFNPGAGGYTIVLGTTQYIDYSDHWRRRYREQLGHRAKFCGQFAAGFEYQVINFTGAAKAGIDDRVHQRRGRRISGLDVSEQFMGQIFGRSRHFY